MVISSPVAPVPALAPYDGVLLVSFGGPEGHDEVMPFLERVTAGRGIPAERLEEVASHYHRRGGISPINAQNRALVDALAAELKALREQGPVGYLKKVTLGWLEKHKDTPDSYAGACILCARLDDSTAPLYAHPVPARELTDADIALCIASADKSFAQERISGKPVLGVWSKHLARAIERHLKGESE